MYSYMYLQIKMFIQKTCHMYHIHEELMHAKKDFKFLHICFDTYLFIKLNNPKGSGIIYNAKATKTVM